MNVTETVLIFAAAETVVGFHNVKPPTQLSQRTNRLLILLGEMREKK